MKFGDTLDRARSIGVLPLQVVNNNSPGPAIAGVLGLMACAGLLLCLGSDQWFFMDEWDFLAGRNDTDLRNYFAPHNGHWSTIPIVTYRLLWSQVGLHVYWPYQLALILAHLLLATLLYMVSRRLGLGAWFAMILVLPFAVFGSGVQNILWAFQLTFVGAVLCGVAQMLLADHDGPTWGGGDWAGLGCGVLGLMFSGVAVAMAIGVGASVLLRRGVRMAVLHTLPLAVIFLLWKALFPADFDWPGFPSPVALLDFAVRAFVHAVEDIGRLEARGNGASAGWLLALLLVPGVVLWLRDQSPGSRRRAAPVVGCLTALVLFLFMIALSRAEVAPLQAVQSRYTHVQFALLLPLIALALAGYQRRWRPAAWLVVLVLYAGLPANLQSFGRLDLQRKMEAGRPDLVRALPYLPEGREAAPDTRPLPVFGHALTMGWLREAVDDGKVPRPVETGPRLLHEARLRLAIVQREGTVQGDCRKLQSPLRLSVDAGDEIGVSGTLVALSLYENDRAVATVRYFPVAGGRLYVQRGPMEIALSGTDYAPLPEFCLASGKWPLRADDS